MANILTKYDLEKEVHKKICQLIEQGMTDKASLRKKLSIEFYINDMSARRYMNSHLRNLEEKAKVLT